MKNETYNGWTNWETWNANLRLTNEEVSYKACMMCNDKNGLPGLFNEFFPGNPDNIDLEEVNWGEIFEGLQG